MGLPLGADEESNLYATITDEESNLYATIDMRPWELRVQNRVPDPLSHTYSFPALRIRILSSTITSANALNLRALFSEDILFRICVTVQLAPYWE